MCHPEHRQFACGCTKPEGFFHCPDFTIRSFKECPIYSTTSKALDPSYDICIKCYYQLKYPRLPRRPGKAERFVAWLHRVCGGGQKKQLQAYYAGAPLERAKGLDNPRTETKGEVC
jgi:hypothetical protein